MPEGIRLLAHPCLARAGEGGPDSWGHTPDEFHSCQRGEVLLSRQSIIGTSPEGPYYNDFTGTPSERILHVRSTICYCTNAAPDMWLAGCSTAPLMILNQFCRTMIPVIWSVLPCLRSLQRWTHASLGWHLHGVYVVLSACRDDFSGRLLYT